jgi:GNAT superfamily N-acetyltransferase
MAYLALLQCANDEETLERLISLASEQAWALGCTGLIGPTGLSPHLGSGVLLDHFHRVPPLHTAYNPPYLPELVANALEPGPESHLFSIALDAEISPISPPNDDTLQPLEPARLAGDLLPLLQVACEAAGDFPPPDASEAEFLLEWLRVFPLSGWVASIDRNPAGFVLLQPDMGTALRRARGGRNPLWRSWLAWRGRRRARSGRLIFGAVLPERRRQGIGRNLWRAALAMARASGWREITAGPVASDSAGEAFLTAMGAQPRQRYRLYGTEEG